MLIIETARRRTNTLKQTTAGFFHIILSSIIRTNALLQNPTLETVWGIFVYVRLQAEEKETKTSGGRLRVALFGPVTKEVSTVMTVTVIKTKNDDNGDKPTG